MGVSVALISVKCNSISLLICLLVWTSRNDLVLGRLPLERRIEEVRDDGMIDSHR